MVMIPGLSSVSRRNGIELRCLLLSLLFIASTIAASPVQLQVNAPAGTLHVDWYAAEKPGGHAVILLHGFMSSKNHHVLNALALSAEGFAVFVPDLKYSFWSSNHSERAADVQYLVQQLRQGKLTATPPDTIALVGHSAGGLTALLAADEKIAALILLDPVTFAGRPGNRQRAIGDRELSRISSPVLSLEAPPDSCNNNRDGGWDFLPLLASPIKERITLLSASHCDFMDPHAGCRLVCGPGSTESRLYAREATVRFLKRFAK